MWLAAGVASDRAIVRETVHGVLVATASVRPRAHIDTLHHSADVLLHRDAERGATPGWSGGASLVVVRVFSPWALSDEQSISAQLVDVLGAVAELREDRL